MGRDYLVRCCLGLVIIETDYSPVRLCHLGLHNYFDEKKEVGDNTFSEGHKTLACTCLRYMLCESLTLEENPSDLRRWMDVDYPFLDYSSCFWSHHVRESGQHDQSVELTARYLSLNPRRRLLSHRKHYKRIFPKSRCDTSVLVSLSGLHIAAYLGFENVVQLLLEQASTRIGSIDSQERISHSIVEINQQDQTLDTRSGDYHIDINGRDSDNGLTPLHWAAKFGHKMVVKKLLESGADCQSRDFDGRTSLHYAVLSENFYIIEILASHNSGQLLNIQDEIGLTALHLAVRLDRSHGERILAMVRLLRTAGAGTDVCSLLGTSPLDEARKLKLDLAVQLLQGANIFGSAIPYPNHRFSKPNINMDIQIVGLGTRKALLTPESRLDNRLVSYFKQTLSEFDKANRLQYVDVWQ